MRWHYLLGASKGASTWCEEMGAEQRVGWVYLMIGLPADQLQGDVAIPVTDWAGSATWRTWEHADDADAGAEAADVARMLRAGGRCSVR